MIEKKHTPSPWFIRYQTNVMGIRRDVGHEGSIANCSCHASNLVDCEAESLANARLIAAAPDLLEELMRLRKKLDEYLQDCDAAIYLGAGDDLKSIDAVLAKAVTQ